MKDQYVGDVNDYLKYALLRELAAAGLSLALGWCWTPDDGGTDGAHLGYLSRPDRFRPFDPELFDVLAELVERGDRSVRGVLASGVLGPVASHSSPVPLEPAERGRWLGELQDTAAGADLLFLDPDNGLEVASVRYGGRGAAKYVFHDEVRALYRRGASVCAYQHFPRVARQVYVTARLNEMSRSWPATLLGALTTSRIALLFAAGARHTDAVTGACGRLVARAGPAFPVGWVAAGD